MKHLLLILLLLTFYLNAEPICSSVDIEAIENLHTKETKKLKLFTLPYADDSMICEAIPHSDKVVIVTTYHGKDGDEALHDVYLLSIVISIANSNTGEILQSHLYKEIGTSDAVEIKNLTIDTKTYSELSKYKPFSITIAQGVDVSQAHAMYQHHFFLFEARQKELKALVDNFDLGGNFMMCENYRVCSGEYVTFKMTAACKTKNYCPITIKTYTTSYYRLPITDDEEPIEGTHVVPTTRKFVFKEGKYHEAKVDEKENIALTFNEVEKGAKSGKYYNRYELARLIYQPLYGEGEFKKVRELNDIAYYLQKSGHNLEAIMLLEVLIKFFPKRTVAYYNVADAYWELGRKDEAKNMYELYVKQMEANGQEKKIPKVVLERVRK